ncbi:aminoglycoside phosphotransferase [Pyrenophora tritici-repentis]|nr:aminoglycoside phosphotransferase [Pyrenophora tritici-repentis]
MASKSNIVMTFFPALARGSPTARRPSLVSISMSNMPPVSTSNAAATTDSRSGNAESVSSAGKSLYSEYFCDDNIFDEHGDFRYGGEKALTLKLQVLQLIADKFPGVETEREPTLEMIGQGSFNVVVGVTLHPPKSRNDCNMSVGNKLTKLFTREPLRTFALRLPLDSSGKLDGSTDNNVTRDIVTLQVISSHLSIPVPQVIKYDPRTDNAVGRPFALQTRLAGESLQTLWERLNMPQKLSAMEQVTKMTEKIARCTSPVAGYISESNRDLRSSAIHVDQFNVPTKAEAERRPQFAQPVTRPAPKQTPHEFLIDQCNRWIAYEATFAHDHHSRVLWGKLKKLINALEERKWLGDRFHLAHGDLFPRNILAEITGPSTVKITGIVDWDMASFAPKFVALRAPFWGWMYDEQNEDGAYGDSYREPGQLMKKAFRAAASKEYTEFGLSVESAVGRKLFTVLRYGLIRYGQRELALQLLQQWHMLHPSDHVQTFHLY